MIYLTRVHDSLLNICRQTIECLLHIDVTLSRDLEERNTKFVSQLLAAFGRYNTFVFPITLVAYKDFVYAFGSMLFDVAEPGADI